jgi:anti-sigma B factor antagonist
MTELSISVTAQAAGDRSCTVVSVDGEADVTTHRLGDVLAGETARKPRLLLLDLTALRFIDSSALHMVVQAYERLRREGGVLALVHPTRMVSRVLHLTAIDQMITVYDSVDEAVEAFRQRPFQGSEAG